MRAFVATSKTAFIEAWANRKSFWLQVSFMIVNDLAIIVFWLVFFGNVDRVRGWGLDQVLLLFAILATVCGIAMGLLGNARRLGQLISDGQLDPALALPMDPLAYMLARTVDTALLGDLVFGPAILLFSGPVTLERTALFLGASLCAAVVFVSFLVILGSITLFVGGRGEPGELGFQAVLMLASYPLDLFGGAIKLILFTAVPAAFITGVPVHVVDDFTWSEAATLLTVAVGSFVAARIVFRAGLKRYRSGALWTRA
ncbi:MAG: ABC transporter permease [Actinomycetota bacterium]